MTQGGAEMLHLFSGKIFRRLTSKSFWEILKNVLTSVFRYDNISVSGEGNEGKPHQLRKELIIMKKSVSVKFDRRRKYYLILDCETATLSCADGLPEDEKKKIAIAKPLIYDLGWTIVDKKGNIYLRENYLISEIFSVPSIFNTAYYAHKRPLYLEKLDKGEIVLTDWRTAVSRLEFALSITEAVGAYNAMFDFKKAIPFTELYINQLYSADFHKWLKFQNECCERIINDTVIGNNKEFDPNCFRFRSKEYPLFDLWGLSCEYLLNNDDYKGACLRNGWQTESGKYFKTSAETTYRFITGQIDFDEAHTAIDDADIESEIFALIVKKAKNKVDLGIEYFPFRTLGTVKKFVCQHPEFADFVDFDF